MIKHVGIEIKDLISTILSNKILMTNDKRLIICFCIYQGYKLTERDFEDMYQTDNHSILQSLIKNPEEYSKNLIDSCTCSKCLNVNNLIKEKICDKCKSKEMIQEYLIKNTNFEVQLQPLLIDEITE